MRFLPLLAVICASLLAWGVLFFSIPLDQQNFPLFDDWAFARGALIFARGEGIDYGHWSAMPQFGLWFWALPFIRLLGDSQTVLRVSTIILSWLGLAAFYDLLTFRRPPAPWVAAFTTGVLAFNPFFFVLSGTFMTDVPTLSFCLIGLALYQRAIESNSFWIWLAAALVAIVAVTTRQNAWALPLAAITMIALQALGNSSPTLPANGSSEGLTSSSLYSGEASSSPLPPSGERGQGEEGTSPTPGLRRRPGLCGWIAATIPLAIGIAVHIWFRARPDVLHPPLFFESRPGASPGNLPDPHVLLILPFLVAHWLGLTAGPIWALLPRISWRRWLLWATALFLCAAYWLHFGYMIPHGGLFPYWDGIFSPAGFVSEQLLPGKRPVLLDTLFRIVVSILGCLLGAGLLARIARRSRWSLGFSRRVPMGDGPCPGHQLLLIFTFFSLCATLATPRLYDRYLLFLMPGLLAMAQRLFPGDRPIWPAGIAAMVALAAFSVCPAHDLWSWNSARWQLGRQALADRIPATDIEGGFEWDGYYSLLSRPTATGHRSSLVTSLDAIFFPYVTGRYALSFSPLPNSEIDKETTYRTWLPPATHHFYLLKEKASQPPPTLPAHHP
jgi:hypothetical protein